MYITNGIVSSKIYFNFAIVNFLFLDGDVSRFPSYAIYVSQLVLFSRVCLNNSDFNKGK